MATNYIFPDAELVPPIAKVLPLLEGLFNGISIGSVLLIAALGSVVKFK